MIWSCDYETNNNPDNCHVWCWGMQEVYTDEIRLGTNIKEFIDYVVSVRNSKCIYYFHNLSFDGEFILLELFRRGYNHTTDRKLKENQFGTLISDMGQWYSIKLCYGRNLVCEFRDSLKILPFSVKDMAKSFGMQESKGKIDYNLDRPIGYQPTNEEWNYLKTDLAIPAHGIKFLYEQGHQRLTAGSNALASYKYMVGKQFKYWFPTLDRDIDAFIRKSYRGGWVYTNPKIIGQTIGKGIVLDVNSLYPSRMRYEILPYGTPQYYKGIYKQKENYVLYVQRLQAIFTLKKGKLPTIQEKHNPRFSKTKYLTSSEGEALELTLTNVDLELFLENYEIEKIEYIDGYMFHGTTGMFDSYVDYWMTKKEEATINQDYAMRTLSKLMQNSLYGKFAKRPYATQKIPYVENGRLKLKVGETEEIEPLYLPVGTFITAYARNYTIRSAMELGERFLYSDTDSLHILDEELPSGIEIHKSKLGAWKHEGTFCRAKYLGAKAYVEELYMDESKLNEFLEDNPTLSNLVNLEKGTLLSITCAGMPDNIKSGVTFENFEIDLMLMGKLKPKHVEGGIVLEETTFTLRKR